MRKTSKVSRNDRLNGEFQKEIYEIITRRLKNPLITEMFSVLKVDSSRDLSYAKVYISVYSKDEQKKIATFNAISSDAKKIRYELAKVIRARTVPELHFVLDDSMEYGDKMDKLFKSINEGEKRD
ncbi:MAG: 30S ribosome-binding factor RbfA [Clostridiales bacterium]|nr:30S ribosome-binding factor RbfA [Clostridiales bacterium]